VKAENIAAAWLTIRELIRALPESEQMRESFLQLHAKHTWEEIGVSREDKDVILKYSPMVRNRLTLMRMKRMFPTL
jgi:glycerol-1-phosphate dehydrogenase [NAD(P)+]